MKSPLRKIGGNASRHYQPRQSPRGKGSGKTFALVLIIAFAGMILQIRWVAQNKEKFRDKDRVALFKSARKAEVMPIVCHHCLGRGVLSWTEEAADKPPEKEFCPICFGTGRNDVTMMQQREMICFECQGMGRTFNEEAEAVGCTRCRSRGLILTEQVEALAEGKPIEYLEIECDVCMGVGTLEHPSQKGKVICTVCFGVGWNIARKIDSSDVICPPCGGMGQSHDPETLENQTCVRCKGWGLIKTQEKAAAQL